MQKHGILTVESSWLAIEVIAAGILVGAEIYILSISSNKEYQDVKLLELELCVTDVQWLHIVNIIQMLIFTSLMMERTGRMS